MSKPFNLSRRGVLRGAPTAALITGCTTGGHTTDPGQRTPVSDTTQPAEIGPDPVPVAFSLNGKDVQATVEPRTTLLEALRLDLDTTGPKVVCDRGACSACTVLVDGVQRSSCMMLAHDVAGRSVMTVEGLAKGDKLSPLQRAFIDHDALQCGFCTSGMLMTCTSLLQRTRGASLTKAQVNDAISGNLCRCGTYPNIVAAVLDVAKGGYADASTGAKHVAQGES
ncbi:MAG: (2Fe-2S)-binding protein [Nannocystaceae bacterium]|nr:(2Fe-2S)-binding protein [Nannocystaceae bacterium]